MDRLQIYLDELENIPSLSDGEMQALAKEKSKQAKDRLIEGNLKYAVQLLYEYVGQGLDVSDLVSEANLALANAINDYNGEGDIKEVITKAVKTAVEAAIKEENESKAADENLAEQVNELSDTAVELVQELGREPTKEELAEKLGTSPEAIDALLRMSMDALSTNTTIQGEEQ